MTQALVSLTSLLKVSLSPPRVSQWDQRRAQWGYRPCYQPLAGNSSLHLAGAHMQHSPCSHHALSSQSPRRSMAECVSALRGPGCGWRSGIQMKGRWWSVDGDPVA